MKELNTQTKQTLEVGYTYSFLPKEKITNKNRGIEISIVDPLMEEELGIYNTKSGE